jgi:hypothetical protein
MPAGNPFAPLIDVGGQAGPASGSLQLGTAGVTVGDHHISAGLVAVGLIVIVVMYRKGFRMSTRIG